MGASKYSRDRKRIYEEAATRGLGWRKAALKRLNKEYGAQPIRRAGKLVGVRLDEDRGVICKKKAFKSAELAEAALEQIERYRPAEGVKPCRVYECQFCGKFHLTSMANWQPPRE